MVFSQTNVNAQRLLKVVEIDRLKSKKNQQVNGLTGVIIGGTTDLNPSRSSPAPTTSYSEDYLKPEPLNENTMFHDSDCEFFQDLVQWCAEPVEEALVQSIDPRKVTEERAHKTDTLHTPLSPQGWEIFDANSPTFQPYPVSPTDGHIAHEFFNPPVMNKIPFQEQFVDINELPVVIGDLASETVNMNPFPETWHYNYTKPTYDTLPFIHQDDSLDTKLVSVIPREVESNDVVVSEYVIDNTYRRGYGLSVDVAQAQAQAPVWPAPDIVSTPDVLSFVEQLENEKHILPTSTPLAAPPIYQEIPKIEHSPTPIDYDFNSPKSEPNEDSEDEKPGKKPGRKRRHDSEDSDESYIPYKEHQPKKYRPRKPSVPIKDMIKALEGAQKEAPKSRRGRPPKMQRRDSTVSTVSNNSSLSTHEMKYRELRDKNNEASKRSRMNRKLKELQMEQMADELEERNKQLRVQADLLNKSINELRKTFMLAVSQKKVG